MAELPNMPPLPVVRLAEQAYANANTLLDKIIREMRQKMVEHPELDPHDSISWMASVLDYKRQIWMVDNHSPEAQEKFRDTIVELLIAAAFRLSRMGPPPSDVLEGMLNDGC